ncbi:MAG: sugar phosphate isomerase/epimerase [Alsobacter sp.]
MTPCFHSVGLPRRSLMEAIGMVADAGYAAIEINAETLPWAPAHLTPAAGPQERRAVREACDARGLVIAAVGAHLPMVMADPAQREAAIAYVDGCTDLARDLGAPVVHILSGPLAPGLAREEAWPWFRTAVERTTEHARRRGVTLGIEAIAGHLFHGADDYRRLASELPGVGFTVNFDPSHLAVQGEDPRRVVDLFGHRVSHVHLKDGAGRFPDFSFPPLGRGVIDFAGLLQGLRAAGYDGALSVEYEAQVFGWNETEDEILGHGRTVLDGLLAG